MAITTALFFLCILTIALAQKATPDGCYLEYSNSKVNCLLPFQSQNVASEQECATFCTQNLPKCKAAQLTDAMSCQLFDKAVPVQKPNRRRRAGGCYGYGPSIINAPGYCYFVPTGYGTGCSGGYGGLSSTSTIAVQSDATTMTSPTTVSTVISSSDSSTTTQVMVSSTLSDSQLPPEVLRKTKLAPTVGSRYSKNFIVTCPAGKVVRYMVVDGYQLSGQPDFQFQADNDLACITACTNNRLPDGRQAPCRSADYNSKTKQCSISLQVTPPVGSTSADANADSKHFEKVCINATTSQNCPGPYFRAPQHILIGFAQAVATASTTAECLELCAISQSRFNFGCSSGMFYFAETSNNCILNSESRTGHPDLFVPENNDGVEYFEPGCTASARLRRQVTTPKKRNRNILQLNTTTFGAWSMCDTVDHAHMRFRECATLNPNRCEMDLNKCDPAKENEYDHDTNATVAQGRLVMSRRGPPPKRSTPKNGTTVTTTAIRKTTTTPKPASDKPKPGTTPKPSASSSTPPKPTSPKPGDCEPLVKSNGKKNCDHGLRTLPNGMTVPCKPLKNECEEVANAQDKQTNKPGPR